MKIVTFKVGVSPKRLLGKNIPILKKAVPKLSKKLRIDIEDLETVHKRTGRCMHNDRFF